MIWPMAASARKRVNGGKTPLVGPNRMPVAITSAHATATRAKAIIGGRCWGERSSESSRSGLSSMPRTPPRPECVARFSPELPGDRQSHG